MKKKIMATGLAAVLTVAMLTGCSDSKKPSGKATDNQVEFTLADYENDCNQFLQLSEQYTTIINSAEQAAETSEEADNEDGAAKEEEFDLIDAVMWEKMNSATQSLVLVTDEGKEVQAAYVEYMEATVELMKQLEETEPQEEELQKIQVDMEKLYLNMEEKKEAFEEAAIALEIDEDFLKRVSDILY